MRIDELRQEHDGGWVTLSARLNWEENDRPAQTLRIEVGESLEKDIECSPNGFLVATAVPAAYFGERRLWIDGEICPTLRDNVLTVLTQYKEWYDPRRVLPEIEASKGLSARRPRHPGRAGQLFSGGIDAWATLRRNRLMYDADHPSSIRDCIHVHGLHPADYRDGQAVPERLELWNRAVAGIQGVKQAANVELHLIRTNASGIFGDHDLQAREYHSALLLSLGHFLTRRFSELSIASSDYIGGFHPWGSHPLIDTYYSSSDLRILHDATRLTRFEKVKLLADWPEALKLLNVCVNWTAPEQGFNCGECDKCLRTMVALLACGKLQDAPTFAANDVYPQQLRNIKLLMGATEKTFDDVLPALRAVGRQDLVAALEERAARHLVWLREKAGRGWKGRIKQWDRKYFGGWMRNTWNVLSGDRT